MFTRLLPHEMDVAKVYIRGLIASASLASSAGSLLFQRLDERLHYIQAYKMSLLIKHAFRRRAPPAATAMPR